MLTRLPSIRILTLLALGPLLRADGQTDLRNALARCTASEPVKSAVDYQLWQSSGPKKQPKVVQGRIHAVVETSPQGLRLLWPGHVLDQARLEARRTAQDPEAPSPVQSAMRELDVLQVQTCLDASEELLRELDQARFLDERLEAWQDKPARRLAFRLEPKLPEEMRKSLKSFEATMTFWIAADGMPLASSTAIAFKASKLLFTIEGSQKEERVYRLRGNRLLVQKQTMEEHTTAMGDVSQSRKILSLSWE